jgi:hypothetical protein
LLKVLEGFEKSLVEVRTILVEGASKPQSMQQSTDTLAVPDINRIKWKIRGGMDASPDNEWAFVFRANRDGSIPSDRAQVVDYLNSHGGKFKRDGFEVSISKDGKFINRNKL